MRSCGSVRRQRFGGTVLDEYGHRGRVPRADPGPTVDKNVMADAHKTRKYRERECRRAPMISDRRNAGTWKPARWYEFQTSLSHPCVPTKLGKQCQQDARDWVFWHRVLGRARGIGSDFRPFRFERLQIMVSIFMAYTLCEPPLKYRDSRLRI